MLLAALLLAAQPATEPTDGCPGTMVAFEPGSARLDARALHSIELILPWTRPMVEAGGWLNLVGNAADAGSAVANRILSRRRAEAISAYLLRRGFRDDQLRVSAMGDTRPWETTGGSLTDEEVRAVNSAALVSPEMPLSVYRRFFPPGAPVC
jgi:outer membrane protein OmpA-like peptidoglycan-associated protein